MEKNELKFRVWNGSEMEHNIMVGKFGIFYVNPSNNGIDENDTASLSPFNTKYHDDIPLMRFTGLIDKNGKEIWEGDIVRCSYGTGKVIFNVGCYMVSWLDDLEAYNEFLFSRKGTYKRKNDEEFEVIGNIYQNPNGFAEAGREN